MEDDEKSTDSPKKPTPRNQPLQDSAIQLNSVPFDSSNHQQHFFRQNQPMGTDREYLTRIGWRICDLSAENDELVLQCMALLSSELIFPVTTTTRLIASPPQRQEEETRSLWMETSFSTSQLSVNYLTLGEHRRSYKIIHFCEKQLLELLQSFIKKHLGWEQLAREGTDSAGTLEAFRKEVVGQANAWIEQAGFFGKERE